MKNVLLGANTAHGFVSYYDQILVPKAKYLGIIKGGPGTGKSTFMRKIGEKIKNEGFALELLRCSSDQDSLDGIVVLDQGIALVDGTRPHIMEPRYPGCQDEIINFGEFWDRRGICAHIKDIVSLSGEISERYGRVYRLLAAANQLSLDWSASHAQGLNTKGINEVVQRLAALFSSLPVEEDGKERHLFASSLSPKGTLHYLESILSPLERVYVLKDTYSCCAHKILERVLLEAKSRGLFVEVYHCALEPERIEHLVIEELSLGFSITCAHHIYTPEEAEVVDLDRFVDLGQVKETSFLNSQKETERQIMAWAGSELATIKTLHDELEGFYFPYMDFEATDKLLERTVERIFELLEPSEVPVP